MLKIDTGLKPVNAAPAQVFTFLEDMNNFQKLMPEQVTNWESDKDTCSFTIKGIATIGMKITDRVPNEKIVVESHGKSPFPFKLNIPINQAGAGSEAGLVFEGEVNPFLKMMVEKPLKNFFTMLVESLGKQF